MPDAWTCICVHQWCVHVCVCLCICEHVYVKALISPGPTISQVISRAFCCWLHALLISRFHYTWVDTWSLDTSCIQSLRMSHTILPLSLHIPSHLSFTLDMPSLPHFTYHSFSRICSISQYFSRRLSRCADLVSGFLHTFESLLSLLVPYRRLVS